MDIPHTILWRKPMLAYSVTFLIALLAFMVGLNLLKISGLLTFLLLLAGIFAIYVVLNA